jgi:hypothetical protein
MGTAKTPQPVKLIVSAFAPDDALLAQAHRAMVAEWGATDWESDLLPFDHTTYYQREFGPGLVRRMWAFERLIDPGTLAAIKVRSNELEGRWLVEDKRRVNLDPGYVSMAKLVLATTKNHGHRIYLGEGIYAEVTLRYQDGAFRPWPWSYPDYATAAYCRMFETIRRRYIEQSRSIRQ